MLFVSKDLTRTAFLFIFLYVGFVLAAADQEDNADPLPTDVVRKRKKQPAKSTNIPNINIELARFDSDATTFHLEKDTGSIIVEAPFNPFGKTNGDNGSDDYEINQDKGNSKGKTTQIERVNLSEVLKAGNLRKGANTKPNFDIEMLDDGGSVPEFLSLSPSEPNNDGIPPATSRAVFGTDERMVFKDTCYPWSTVGKLSTGCTGTMVGPRHVLTAAHCLSTIPSSMSFTPAYYNGEAPFGTAKVRCTLDWGIVDSDGSNSRREAPFDYAVLILDRDIGDLTGWVGYRTYNTRWNGDQYWDHVGYPGGLTNSERPVFTKDDLFWKTENDNRSGGLSGMILGHFIDVEGGHSGGPMWGWWPNENFPRIVAVHSSSSFNPAYTQQGDNQASGGASMTKLIKYARENY